MARNRRYMLFLAVENVTYLGYAIYAVAIVWFSYRFGGGLVASGEVLAIEYAGYAATFLFGPLVDRAHDKRILFVTTFPVQAAIIAGIAYAGEAGTLQPWELLGGVAAVSVLWDIAWAAFNAIPRLLLTPDELFAAGGVGGILATGTTLTGYFLGGVAIIAFGAPGGLYLYAAALAVGSVLALLNPIYGSKAALAGFAASLREGWRLILVTDRPVLGGLALADIARGVVFAGPTLLMVAVAQSRFHASATAFAVFYVASVIGTTSADVLLGRLNPRRWIGPLLFLSMAMAAGASVALGLLPSILGLLLGAWFAVGFSIEVYVNARLTFVRARVPPELQGRISGNLYLFTGLPSALGAVLIASLAATNPLGWIGLLVGGGFAGCAVLLIVQPTLRRLAF